MKLSYKGILTIFILIITFSTSIAQVAKVKWGPEEKGDKSHGSINALGWNQGSFYTIQTRMTSMAKRKFYLEKLDKNLKLVYSKKLETKNYGISYAKIINNQIYFFQIRNKGMSMKEVEFYYNVYDLDGNFIKEVIVANIDGFKRWNQLMSGYWIGDSPDGKKVGFALTDENLKDGYIRLINGIVEVSDLSKANINSKTISVSEDIKQSRLYGAKITNDGAIVNTLGYRDDYDTPYLYNLITLQKDGNYAEPIALKFEDDLYFDRVELVPNGNGKLIFTGFYLTKGKRRNLINGFFIATLNTISNKIETFSDFAYTEEFFQSLGYKIKNNGRVKFSGSYNLEIIPNKKSGGGFLIANHTDVDKQYRIATEAIIIPYDKSGELGEKMILPKAQSASGGSSFSGGTIGGRGYFAFCKNDKLYMLYNGSLRNINVSDLDELKPEKEPDSRKSATILATIEKGNGVKREKLFTYKERGGYLVPDKCFNDKNQTLISIIDKKKIRYGTLEVQ